MASPTGARLLEYYTPFFYCRAQASINGASRPCASLTDGTINPIPTLEYYVHSLVPSVLSTYRECGAKRLN